MIEKIRAQILKGNYAFKKHAIEKMDFRDLDPLSVKEAILNGKIIEDYPEDKRGHSCLIWGKNKQGANIHVVCGIAHEMIWIITAYEPSANEWETPERRKRK